MKPTASTLSHFKPFGRVVCGAMLALGLGLAWPVWAAAPFTVNGNGTVTDSSTSLVWDQCPYGMSGSACATGTAFYGDWASALASATSANAASYRGFTDWRLPNVAELESLVKIDSYTVGVPAIDTTAFPGTPLHWFWTSTSFALVPSLALFVNFSDGFTSANGKTVTYYVRLVRSGQSLASFDSSLTAQAITGFAPTTPVVFGAAPATLTASGGASGNPVVFATNSAGSICSVSGTQVTFVGIGVCNLTADQVGGGNYNAAPQVTASVTVTAAAQVITGFAPSTPVLLGAAPATLTGSGGASGNPVVFATSSAGSICSVSGTQVTFVGIGVCNLTANQAAGGNYSAAPQVTASVTINAPLGNSTVGIPTLSEWGQIVLSGFMLLFGLAQVRRRG